MFNVFPNDWASARNHFGIPGIPALLPVASDKDGVFACGVAVFLPLLVLHNTGFAGEARHFLPTRRLARHSWSKGSND